MRRFDCDTANWHVFARGARRLRLFRDKQDYGRFLNCLVYALERSGCVLWAFALMSNHYHLVIRGNSAQLTSCMRRLNLMYSRYHNKRYRLDGHTFDGPYQAFRQGTPLLMLHTMAYVFFNPVKAGLCQTPEEYAWSCCRCYLNLPGSPLFIDAARLLSSIDSDVTKTWARFHEAMSQEARRAPRPTAGRPSMLELHEEQFQWLLEHAKETLGRHRESPLLVAMYWARQVGITPKAIARVLGKSATGSARAQLFRFWQRVQNDPELRERVALS